MTFHTLYAQVLHGSILQIRFVIRVSSYKLEITQDGLIVYQT